MSKYTVELRYICETAAGLEASVGGDDVDRVIQNAIPSIFNFSFPIFDESYRNVLETKILMHYYTREIAHETVGLWKLKLKTKLNEIMPYYNQLYKSELLDFNPLYDVDITRTHVRDSSGTRDTDENRDSESTGNIENTSDRSKDSETITNNRIQNQNDTTDDGTVNSTSNNTDKYSDTPQGSITDLSQDKYLTNARLVSVSDNTATHGTNSTTQNGTTDGDTTVNESENNDSTTDTKNNSSTNRTEKTNLTDTETYLETVQGKQGGGDYSEMLLKFRDTFLNIDMMVINDLEELFFQLW